MSAVPAEAALGATLDAPVFRFEAVSAPEARSAESRPVSDSARDRLASIESARIAALLAATVAGSAVAFAELYARTSPRIYGLLLRMLQRPELAQEAMQDCYVRVWQRAETYCPERGEAMAWLIGVARHRALDVLRARSLRTDGSEVGDEALADLVDGAISPELAALNSEDAGLLDYCLRRLRPELRRSLVLAYYEGYSHSELARVLDAPLGTVKAWVRRGLKQLRACLRE